MSAAGVSPDPAGGALDAADAGVDVLAVMAHPDDAELLCGGTLARLSDLGRRTGVLDLTAGEAGTWGSAWTRQAEARTAATILGLARRESAGLPDGALENAAAARAVVAGWIRRLRPRVVVLHWHEGRHPDHRVAARLGYDACFLAGLRNAPLDGEPHRPTKVVHALAYREDAVRPSFVVDITGQIERKLDAIFAFASQLEGRTALGEIFGGGSRPIREQILAHAAHYGSLIRRPYGEPFWMRETFEVEDLMELGVPTF